MSTLSKEDPLLINNEVGIFCSCLVFTLFKPSLNEIVSSIFMIFFIDHCCFQFTKIKANTTIAPPINKFNVKASCKPIIEKSVENTGTKNKKLLAVVAPF